jgi:hypothetical protein
MPTREAIHTRPLESQKRRLIAESELNRAQLSEDWRTLTQGVRDVAEQINALAAWASLVVALWAGGKALRRRPIPPRTVEKLSWFQKVLNGTRVASEIWFALRARDKRQPRTWQPPPPSERVAS